MPAAASSLLRKAAFASAIAVGIYGLLLGALMTPSIQRFALYAHKINTLFAGDDLNKPEAFGFAKHQVTPFNLKTPDGETLYGWHVLPLDVYARNEKSLLAEHRPHGPYEDFRESTAFRLLTADDAEPARVVVTFHGNAGHVAQGWRTDTYRLLATQPNTHVLTIDYRGFGYSSGSPTEAGLVTDGTTLIDWILKTANVPPERITIVGQSLGTAVASAMALHYADPASELIPSQSQELRALSTSEGKLQPTTFAGVILVAPFSSLPSLMLTYRIGGFLPFLLPLRPFPYLAGLLTSQMVDKWLTAERLEAYYDAVGVMPQLLIGASGRSMGSVQLVHSTRDMDIPHHQTSMICRRIFGQGKEPGVYEGTEADGPVQCVDGSSGATVLDVKAQGRPRVRFEIIEYGGHNRLVTYSNVAVAVMRAFEDLFD
ncbi:hypothetical protein LTR08_005640 [Meristemomyces frigidus]|nr:hypothetical protein LTR08_005640 [Meristemomyces frigidus]